MKFYKIPGSKDLKISDSLMITDHNGNVVDRVELFGRIVDKSPEWFYGISRIC